MSGFLFIHALGFIMCWLQSIFKCSDSGIRTHEVFTSGYEPDLMANFSHIAVYFNVLPILHPVGIESDFFIFLFSVSLVIQQVPNIT